MTATQVSDKLARREIIELGYSLLAKAKRARNAAKKTFYKTQAHEAFELVGYAA